MRTIIKPFFFVFLVSTILLSCKSNADYLKDATKKMNELSEAISNTKHEVEFDRYVAEYNKYMASFPKSLQEMTEEQIAGIKGGQEYLEAMESFDEVYMAKSRFFAFAGYDEAEDQDPTPVEPEQETEDIMPEEETEEAADIMNEPTSEPNTEDNYILTPGVTYITATSATDTDAFGLKVNLTMEFTIYKDGTATGNLIETNVSNSKSYNHPLEGTWDEVSKHDKRLLKISLELESDDYYNEFIYYIDEDLNAYANNLNATPVKLKKK